MITGPHATPLRLIHAVHPLPTERAPVPSVLCQRTVARLATLNTAVRRLRELGVRIVAAQVDGDWPADDEPLVRIERDPQQSFAAFLDEAGPRVWAQLHGTQVTQASALFHGVMVVWEESHV